MKPPTRLEAEAAKNLQKRLAREIRKIVEPTLRAAGADPKDEIALGAIISEVMIASATDPLKMADGLSIAMGQWIEDNVEGANSVIVSLRRGDQAPLFMIAETKFPEPNQTSSH